MDRTIKFGGDVGSSKPLNKFVLDWISNMLLPFETRPFSRLNIALFTTVKSGEGWAKFPSQYLGELFMLKCTVWVSDILICFETRVLQGDWGRRLRPNFDSL